MKLLSSLLFIAASLFADSLYVMANQNFVLEQLTAKQIKKIYLKHIDYIEGVAIYPLHLPAQDRARELFRKKILQMHTKELKRYWTKAHYRGEQPPLVQNSQEAIFTFVRKFDGAIGYALLQKRPKNVKILYKVDAQ